ncbi:hypothetical protein BX666DRAFT_1940156 [Dichotomocladium elegans]|nr:hypothetical protein BX666DRAFT_1940156 [Dichotomocladium elegans]
MSKSKSTSSVGKIPRPMNCFLAFRLAKQSEILSHYPGANHRDISKILARLWKGISEDEKEPYRELARLAKAEHSRLYPGYRYQPKKKGERKRRRYTRRISTKSMISEMDENNQLVDILLRSHQICNSERARFASWSNNSLSIGCECYTSSSSNITRHEDRYSISYSEPLSLNDSLVNFFPPLSYYPEPFMSAPDPLNLYSQPQEIFQQHCSPDFHQHLEPVIPYAVLKQPAAGQDMLPSAPPTCLIVPLNDMCSVQVTIPKERDYLCSTYPPCYYCMIAPENQ